MVLSAMACVVEPLLRTATVCSVVGTLFWIVTDPSGAVLPNATVVILNEETGISRTVQTDGGGRYNAPALGLGRYKVTTSMEGFQTEARSGIVSIRVPRPEAILAKLTAAGVVLSLREGILRFSPHCGNSYEDIDCALEALKAAL